MNKYIFTFGSGHLYQGFYQPIFASDRSIARLKMIELYGLKWGFEYTEEEWNKTIKDYSYGNSINWERPLEAVYCD